MLYIATVWITWSRWLTLKQETKGPSRMKPTEMEGGLKKRRHWQEHGLRVSAAGSLTSDVMVPLCSLSLEYRMP